MTKNYLRYYNLETYLFDDVSQRFHKDGKLDAFDLFSIIVWKANRSKSKLAHRLMKATGSLEEAAAQFTQALFEAKSHEDRLLLAMETWGFHLPMASAILTVLWPKEFTVYDVRVCDELTSAKLGDFSRLGNISPKQVWPKYCEYCKAVENAVPEQHDLRDKDRFLWGRSAALQLENDIKQGFPKTTQPETV
jgi:hypothetical protein